MNNFDVFINGIQPDHIDNNEQIIESSSQCLKISVAQIEKLLNSPDIRIRRSVSEIKAKQYQEILNRIGVICFYKSTTPDIERIEDSAKINTESTSSLSCPNCNHQLIHSSNETLPEVCDKCGIYIDLYLTHKANKKNKKQTQKKVAKSQNKRKKIIQKNQNKKKCDPHSLSLQKNAKKKQLTNKDKKLKRPPPTFAKGILVLTVLASISYTFFKYNESPSGAIIKITKDTATDAESNTTFLDAQKTIEPAFEEQKEKPVEFVVTNGKIDVSTIGTNTTHYETEQDFSNNFQLPRPLQKTQSQSSDILDQKTSPFSDSISKTQPISNPLESTKPHHLQNGSSKTGKSEKDVINTASNALFQFAVDNQEWDNFLTQKIEDSITDGTLKRSHRLISCLSEPEKQISSLAKLLISTRKEKDKIELLTKMEDEINSSPRKFHSQLFSQAGRYQPNLKMKNDLYTRAEKSWSALSDPEEQLNAALRIAISYFKDGNIKSTNRYLMKITTLLPKINIADADSQIKSRVAISRAYKDTDNVNYALQWIKDSENIIDKAGENAVQDLVEGYAYLNQHASVLRLVKKISSINKQDELFYSAIRAYLATGQTDNAVKLNRSIQGATYKALSYILIASYSTEYQSYSILAESTLNMEINSPIDKAIVSSRLAQLYARQYNIYKTEKQLKITKQQINAIPASPEKDTLLNIVATNYARSLMLKPATAFVSAIRSSTVKSQFNKEFSKLSELSAL